MTTHDKTTKDFFSSQGFGISNGVVTILSILAGFIATKASKIVIIGTLLALLITDPLTDSYSIYISMKDSDEEKANEKFKGTLITQLSVQLTFFLIMLIAPTPLIGFLICSFIGIGLVVYDYYKRFKEFKKVMIEIGKMLGLILFTFVVDKIAVLINNRKKNKSVVNNTRNNTRYNTRNNTRIQQPVPTPVPTPLTQQ